MTLVRNLRAARPSLTPQQVTFLDLLMASHPERIRAETIRYGLWPDHPPADVPHVVKNISVSVNRVIRRFGWVIKNDAFPSQSATNYWLSELDK